MHPSTNHDLSCLRGQPWLRTNHSTNAGHENAESPRYDQADSRWDPARLEQWCRFHQQVEQLPESERQVIDLRFYRGKKQEEVAEQLGISVRMVQKRQTSA